jgi:hypothetical protein
LAIPAPIPRLAPVTRARLPASDMAISFCVDRHRSITSLIYGVNYFMYRLLQKELQA